MTNDADRARSVALDSGKSTEGEDLTVNAAAMIDSYFNIEAAVEHVAAERDQWMGQYVPLQEGWLNWAEVTRKGEYRWVRANQDEVLHFSERVGPTVYIRENDGAVTRELVFNIVTQEVDEYSETANGSGAPPVSLQVVEN